MADLIDTGAELLAVDAGAASGVTSSDGSVRVALSDDGVDLSVKQYVDGKQDKLTAGDNITIKDNVISATGGGSVWTIESHALHEPADEIVMNEYVDSTYSGYSKRVNASVPTGVDKSVLRLFNTGEDSDIDVVVYTDRTLFGVGQKMTGACQFSVSPGSALMLKVDGRCMFAGYSTGSLLPSMLKTQKYNSDGNPLDLGTFSTTFKTSFKTGIERVVDSLGTMTMSFMTAMKPGIELLGDLAGKMSTKFNISMETE